MIIASAETLVRIQRQWPFGLEALETALRLREVLRSVSGNSLLSNCLALWKLQNARLHAGRKKERNGPA